MGEGLVPYTTGIEADEIGAQQAGSYVKEFFNPEPAAQAGPGAELGAPPGPAGPFMPGDELKFGEAFKMARRAGVSVFTWKDSEFNTRYKDESDAAWDAELSAASNKSKGASQADMKKSPVGKMMSGSLLEEISEKLDALLSLDETLISEQFGSLSQVQDIFKQQNQQLGPAMTTPEGDVARHVAGARESMQQAGLLPALLGSQGHELNTLVNVAQRMGRGEDFNEIGSGGQQLTPGRYTAETAQDIINNFIGMGQGAIEKLGLRPLPETPPSNAGVSIDEPGSRMAQVGGGIESIVNKLAARLRPGGLGGQ